MLEKVSVIDMFCGAGGMTYGLTKAGLNVRAGVDIDLSCQYPFEANNDSKFIGEDIQNISASKLRRQFKRGDLKIMVGCAPCQPFSSHTQKNRHREKDDRWKLMLSFASLITEIRPEVVSMENVPQVANFSIFEQFVRKLKRAGYSVSWGVPHCVDYGVPQARRRLVLLASKLGEVELLPPTHKPSSWRTVEKAIASFEPIAAGEVSANDKLHRSSALTELNFKRIKKSKPGGSWRDWGKQLRSPCHRKTSGEKYSSVYSRMEWEKPAPTITTQFYCFGTGRFGHPEQDRAISLREGSVLQTFPRNYKFVAPREEVSVKRLGMHIGNAVPVRMAEIIGRSIVRHLENT